MKTKLAPLALLIPAVVLAQPAPPAPAPQPPQNQLIPKINVEQNALPNPAGLNKAAATQALIKARIKRPSDKVTSVGGSYITYENSKFYCRTPNAECTNTKYL
jgi:hypothetical protein